MGATSINVSIFKDGKLDFTRMIRAGGDDIDYALSQSLNISLKSAEAMKIRDVNILKSEGLEKREFIIKSSVNDILDELDRILRFYNNKSEIKLGKIYIYGGISNLKGLNIYMEEKFNIPVIKFEEVKSLDYRSVENIDDNIHQYLNAIGAIIRL